MDCDGHATWREVLSDREITEELVARAGDEVAIMDG